MNIEHLFVVYMVLNDCIRGRFGQALTLLPQKLVIADLRAVYTGEGAHPILGVQKPSQAAQVPNTLISALIGVERASCNAVRSVGQKMGLVAFQLRSDFLRSEG